MSIFVLMFGFLIGAGLVYEAGHTITSHVGQADSLPQLATPITFRVAK
jgi:hypothetical protein